MDIIRVICPACHKTLRVPVIFPAYNKPFNRTHTTCSCGCSFDVIDPHTYNDDGSIKEVDDYDERPIDRTLKILESIAAMKGLRLEDVDGYVELCSFLADLDVYGYSCAQFDKADCLRVLKALITYVCPSWADDPMAFHRNCQPLID